MRPANPPPAPRRSLSLAALLAWCGIAATPALLAAAAIRARRNRVGKFMLLPPARRRAILGEREPALAAFGYGAGTGFAPTRFRATPP